MNCNFKFDENNIFCVIKTIFKISCIIPIYNGGLYLEAAIESVIAQSIGFSENIQLILINDGSSDNTEDICLKYNKKYPYNIYYILSGPDGKNKGVSVSRNAGIRLAEGEFISFLDADDLLDPYYYETAIQYLSQDNNYYNVDVAAFPIKFYGDNKKIAEPVLNFRFNKTRIVNIEDEPAYIQFGVHSTVIRKSAISDILFSEDLHYSEDAEFMHRVLLKKMAYYLIVEPAYLYRRRNNDEINNSVTQKKLTQKTWYDKFEIFGKLLLQYSLKLYGRVVEYTQSLILHDISTGIITKLPDSIHERININNVITNISISLCNVSNEIIMANKFINKWHKYYFLYLKHKIEYIKYYKGKPAFYLGNYLYERLDPLITIHKANEENGKIKIYGSYHLPKYDNFKLIYVYNNSVTCIEEYNCFTDNSYYLGMVIHKVKGFKIIIKPVLTKYAKVLFYIVYENKKYPAKIEYFTSDNLINYETYFYILLDTQIISRANTLNGLHIELIN